MVRQITCLMVLLGVILSGCSQKSTLSTIESTSTPRPTGKLTPYQTVTPIPFLPSPTIEVTIPVTPSPTPTPYLYSVKGDDTMLSIAYQFGITLEELQAANPTVDPHFMGEGLQLIIPIAEETPETLVTPTSVALQTGSTNCYRTGDGGAWCITAIANDTGYSIENISVWIGLYNHQGENFTSQTAYAPMNILRPGSNMPLMTYFAAPLPDEFSASSEVTGALEVSTDDPRYIDAQVRNDSIEINPDGQQAVIKGEVIFPASTSKISQLWVLAVAFDAGGNIVGVRKWKSAGETGYEIPIYSLAGPIDHVETLVEARP